MSEWPQYRLTDIATYHNGLAFKPSDWSEDGLPIIRIEQLNNPAGPSDKYLGYVPEVNYVRDGDLVFSWSATLKVVIWKHGDGAVNQHLFKVIPKHGFHPQFVFFMLDWHMDALSAGSHGSTMKHIKRSELEKFKVHVPPIHVQMRISQCLSSIDTVIEKTEALIAKHQQIKAGLMRDLLTRGVLPNGQLRPPRNEAPELYQETGMGWIPKDWQVAQLAECLASAPKNGYSPREVDTWEGVYVLGLGCLTKDGFEAKQLKNAPGAAAMQSGAVLEKNDLLISRANTPELVGLCGIFPGLDSPVIYPDLMMRLTVKQTIDKHFLEAQLLQPETRSRLTALAVGTSSSMAKLNATSVNKFRVLVPSLIEQRLILKQSKTVDDNIRSTKIALNKLKLQKLGLMQELLTGKVAVTVHPEHTEATA